LAALFLSGALILLLIGGRSPIVSLMGIGDTYLMLHGPLGLESRLLQSDVKSRLETTRDGTKLIGVVQVWRERLREELGPVYNFAGWTLRAAMAIRPEGSPVIAINPGILSPFGNYLFHRAGFIDTTLGSERALQKNDMVMVGSGGFWILGDADGVRTAIEAERNPALAADRERLSNLVAEVDTSAVINILALPSGINRHLNRLYGEKTAILLEDWVAVSSWDGLAVSLSANRKKIFIRGTLLEQNSPLPVLFRQLAKSPSFSDWLAPQTLGACRIGVPRPLNLLRDAQNVYKDRQGARDILDRAEIEIKTELGLNVAELADIMRDEIGFVNFTLRGKPHTVLIAGLKYGADKYLAKFEKDISGTEWKSVLGAYEIRYMKRLLAYSVVNHKLIIASDPGTLGAYLDGIKEGEAPDDLVALGDHYSYSPLMAMGSLFDETAQSTGEVSAARGKGPWYGIAVEKRGKKLGVEMTITGKMGPKWGPPWSIRFLMWAFWLVKLAMYVIVLATSTSLISRTAQIYRLYANR